MDQLIFAAEAIFNAKVYLIIAILGLIIVAVSPSGESDL